MLYWNNIANPRKKMGYNGDHYIERKKNGKYKHPYFANAIFKYGWNNIKHEILYFKLSKELACSLEKQLISHYKLLNQSYNVTDGGEGTCGYKFSEETIKIMSEKHKGLKQSEETIAKRVSKNKGKRRTDDQKKKTSKCVIQYDKNENIISEYFGINEASRLTGINARHISECCRKVKHRKTAGGFIWRFADDKKAHPDAYKLAHDLHSEFKRRNYVHNDLLEYAQPTIIN